MHPNPAYHTADTARNLGFARDRGFGLLAVAGGDAPLLSHVPFVLSGDGKTADLHLMRSNPVARAATTSVAAKIAVQGPDSYISPDWYGVQDQVPTWNYIAVHLTGTLEPLPAKMLRDVLDRLSAQFEQRLLPKPAWSAAKMDAETLDRMMRMILPFRFHVETVDGTWKLNQNKPDAVRQRAADQVEACGQGSEIAMLAALMRRA